jgi:hypothetical protein
MLKWHELIDYCKTLKEGSVGLERSKLADCMVQVLPSLHQAVQRLGVTQLAVL